MAVWAGTIAFFAMLLLGDAFFPMESMLGNVFRAVLVTVGVYLVTRQIELTRYRKKREQWEKDREEEAKQAEIARAKKIADLKNTGVRQEEWSIERINALESRLKNPEQFKYGVIEDITLAHFVVTKLASQGVKNVNPEHLTIPDMAALTGVFKLDSDEVEDLEGIQYAKNLKGIVLSGMDKLKSLDPLAELDGLAGLYIDASHAGMPNVTDVRPLAEMKGLQELLIGRMRFVNSFAALSALTNLGKLFINGNSKNLDLSVFERLPKLTTLQISDVKGYEDLSQIGTLHTLTTLGLNDVGAVGSLEPLGKLRNLTTVALNKVYLDDPETLTALRRVKDLQMGLVGGLPDLDALTSMQDLESLVLIKPYHWTFEPENFSLAPLAELPNLKKISLSPRTTFKDFEAIEKVPKREITG